MPTESAISAAPAGDQDRYRAMRRVTLIGGATNILLAMVQISGGLLTQSYALVADGMHTLSDLLSDLLVWLAAKHASKSADEDHPYGHRRIETMATVGLAIALTLVGISIGHSAAQRLLDPSRLLDPVPLALVFAAISILAKEALFHYGMQVAERVGSNMLRANAWHHRSDVISSLVVFVGIAGTFAGLPFLDAVAALAVAVLIVRMGIKLGWQATEELVDTALEPERVALIRKAIFAVDGVKALHTLRTRRMGEQALADVHLQVNPRISVSEGHRISEAVSEHLIETFEELSDVTVHIDPENDETRQPCRHLPLRDTLIDALQQHWSGLQGADAIENVQLHYLGGYVHLEIHLPLSAFADVDSAHQATQALIEASKRHAAVGEVIVYFRCDCPAI